MQKPKADKPTLQQKLEKRKFRTPSAFVTGLYNAVGSTVLLPKYAPHFSSEVDINDREGAAFLVWNHLSRLDHLYTMKLVYPGKYNMVAGYSEFFRSHLHTVFRLNRILPKKIFTQDRLGIKAMNQIIKQGGIVAFSPEGMSSIYGCNQPVVTGTGHFLRHYGIPVYCVRMRGQYLTSTKHYLEERKGRTEAHLFLLFTPEQLKEMTDEQVEDALNEEFRHDEFEWTKQQGITWQMHGHSCEHLDEICYRCPRCGSELLMHAEGSDISCTVCGNGAMMDDKYEFIPFNGGCVIPESPSKWVLEERKHVIKQIREDPDFSFSEHVTLGCLPEDRYVKNMQTSVPCGEGTFTVDHTGVSFEGVKDGQPYSFKLNYSSVYTLVIMTSTAKFALYVNNRFLEFTPDRRSVGKLLLLVEEMHRYHVNVWRNFKWYDYLYDGLELGIDVK